MNWASLVEPASPYNGTVPPEQAPTIADFAEIGLIAMATILVLSVLASLLAKPLNGVVDALVGNVPEEPSSETPERSAYERRVIRDASRPVVHVEGRHVARR